MRRRLFWTIAVVAAVTGLLVLGASAVASQRAAVSATYREMGKSAIEAVGIIEEFQGGRPRPGVAADLLRLLEGDQLGPFLGRIRRAAGGSEIAFAVVADDDVRTNADLFDRIEIAPGLDVSAAPYQALRSDLGELVVVAPAHVAMQGVDRTVLVALAREAPVVRLADQFRGFFLIGIGIAAVSAILARLLSTQVTDRLKPLAGASRTLAAGDLAARVPDLGDPELDEVAHAFNEMASALETAETREREFILGVGHDLRTPLTTIGGYAEALEAGEIDVADIPRIGAVLGVQTRQLSRLIEDLSMLARLEQPEFSLRMEPVDVGAHVSEVVSGFQRKATEMGVRLEVEDTGGVVVETDPDRLGQIAQNLVENALRYTPEAGSVVVTVRREDGEAVVRVADTGLGITEEDLPKIFDRHYVGRQRQVRNEGSGLGLSIVAGLVERMGGSVSASSTPPRGTTIEVRLPA